MEKNEDLKINMPMSNTQNQQSRRLGEVIANNTPIQMGTVTDCNGYIHPRWFKYQNEDRQIIKVDIERVVCQEHVKYAGIHEKRIVCTMIIDATRCVAELRYNIESQKWRIFQVLSS